MGSRSRREEEVHLPALLCSVLQFYTCSSEITGLWGEETRVTEWKPDRNLSFSPNVSWHRVGIAALLPMLSVERTLAM